METETKGLNIQEWAKWRKSLIMTGTYIPHEWEKLDPYQKKWTGDTLNTLNSIREEI